MFVRYDKTFHVFPVTAKYNLDKTQVQRLFAGEMIVEEKMDGANIGIIRHDKGFSLQKRGSLVGPSEHEQFHFFNNWAHVQNYDKIMALPKGSLLYGELLYAQHTIFYDKLPDYVLIFDVKINGKWLDYDKRIEFCQKYNFHTVPFIARGSFDKNELMKLVPTVSKYGSMAEGIVVKRYAKHGYFRGKIVRPEFIKAHFENDDMLAYNIKKNLLKLDHQNDSQTVAG